MILTRDSISREKDTIRKMIELYCRKRHGDQKEMCAECKELLEYAYRRLERCKFGNKKPTCERCPVHCYKPQMRERVKRVMRFAGPRMIIYHPVDAIIHMLKNIKASNTC